MHSKRHRAKHLNWREQVGALTRCYSTMQRMQTSVEDRGVERVSSRGKIQQLLGRLRQTSIGLRTQFVGTLSNAAATPPVRAAELKLPIRKPIHKKSQRHTHTPRMSEGATKMVHGRSGRRLRVPQAKRAVAADDSDDHAFVAAMAKMTEDQMQARQALVDTEVAEEKKRLTAELRVAESTNTHLLGAAKKAFEQAREEIDAIGRKVSHQYSRNPRDKLVGCLHL